TPPMIYLFCDCQSLSFYHRSFFLFRAKAFLSTGIAGGFLDKKPTKIQILDFCGFYGGGET
ncbi:hypothetical protein, partial [Clostridium sp. YIM B02506]|uniref:hypothetical protein n=1 Tax=Clostridium sp. YIM B02506 TaxID=2910680 RepID=UPI001EED986D